MFRILLFIGTNLAIVFVLSIALSLFGFEGYLDSQGVDLNLGALLVFAAVLGFGGSLISLFISKWSAKRMTGARVIEKPRDRTEQWLVETVHRQAAQAGIGNPEVAIFQAPQPNAFATGWNRNKALVAVSTGLMQQMEPDEIEAVLGHEISHVANGDMVTLALIQGVVNTFVIFLSRVIGHVVDRVVFKTQRGHGADASSVPMLVVPTSPAGRRWSQRWSGSSRPVSRRHCQTNSPPSASMAASVAASKSCL